MGSHIGKHVARNLATGAAVLALALAFTVAPVAVGPAGFDGAAHAKNEGKGGDNGNRGGGDRGNSGSKGGNGGNKGGNGNKGAKGGSGNGAASKGGGSLAKSFRESPIGEFLNRGQAKKQERASLERSHKGPKASQSTQSDVWDDAYGELEAGDLHPSQKGRWNAAKANQNAIDAHIRNQNFNGTIGALSQYQLSAKAASGAVLSPSEQAALESFIGKRPEASYTDEELADILNGDRIEGLPEFEVRDGVASCVANCNAEGFDPETIDADANAALDEYRTAEADAAYREAVEDFYRASEQRIIDESNKSTAGIEDALLDNVARDLGFERPDFREPDFGDPGFDGFDPADPEPEAPVDTADDGPVTPDEETVAEVDPEDTPIIAD